MKISAQMTNATASDSEKPADSQAEAARHFIQYYHDQHSQESGIK